MMRCLDSGHDSSLLCGSVLKTRYQISETHSCIENLLERLAATVLGQHYFQGQIFRCLWVHRAQRIAQAPPADSFCAQVSWSCWLPTHSWKDTPFLLSLPHFTSHSMIHFAYMHPFSADILQYPLPRFHKVKSIHFHVPDRFLLLQGAQLPGQLSGSTHPFSGFLHRRLFLSASQILLSWPLQALFDLETRPVSLCLQALGRFPFQCCNLPARSLYDGSCAFESTAQKKEVQTWDKSKLLIKLHSGHGKQAVISLTEGQGNWGSLPRS